VLRKKETLVFIYMLSNYAPIQYSFGMLLLEKRITKQYKISPLHPLPRCVIPMSSFTLKPLLLSG